MMLIIMQSTAISLHDESEIYPMTRNTCETDQDCPTIPNAVKLCLRNHCYKVCDTNDDCRDEPKEFVCYNKLCKPKFCYDCKQEPSYPTDAPLNDHDLMEILAVQSNANTANINAPIFSFRNIPPPYIAIGVVIIIALLVWKYRMIKNNKMEYHLINDNPSSAVGLLSV